MSDKQIILPMVPGLGLTLLKCHFENYQRTRGKDREPLTFENCEEEVDKFRKSVIYEKIFQKEKEEDVYVSCSYPSSYSH